MSQNAYNIKVLYQPYLSMQFSWAFDIYLEIIHHGKKHICVALKHDTMHWRLLNDCPAYVYILQDEPKLHFDWLVCVDGNNSLKQWNKSVYDIKSHEDQHIAQSDFWLCNKYIDRFKYDVTAKTVSTVYAENSY